MTLVIRWHFARLLTLIPTTTFTTQDLKHRIFPGKFLSTS